MRDFVANDLRWCSLGWPKHHVVRSISVEFEPVICQVVLQSLLPQECPSNPESHVFIKQIKSSSISCYWQSQCKYLFSENGFLFTHSFPNCLYKLAMPLEPSGEYAVTTILFALQKSTSSCCWKYTCSSICNEAGLMMALSKMRWIWRWLKFEMPMLLIKPVPTNSSNFCAKPI